MKKTIYTRDEFIKESGLTSEIFNEWEKRKILRPDGSTDDRTPFYTRASVEMAVHIKSLQNLGYKMEDILKIIRKFGTPKKGCGLEPQPKTSKLLTIGDLAERAGISPRTIKHWEEVGIIEPDRRSEGGFRLYSEIYVYFCELIKDLQLFGYSLEEIKKISGLFRDFLTVKNDLNVYSVKENMEKLDEMLHGIKVLYEKMGRLKTGIERWDDLLKKKKKEIVSLKTRNRKRLNDQKQYRLEE